MDRTMQKRRYFLLQSCRKKIRGHWRLQEGYFCIQSIAPMPTCCCAASAVDAAAASPSANALTLSDMTAASAALRRAAVLVIIKPTNSISNPAISSTEKDVSTSHSYTRKVLNSNSSATKHQNSTQKDVATEMLNPA